MTSVAPRTLGHTVQVRRVIRETPEALSFVLDVPEDLAERFTYSPGQFVTVRIPSDRTGSVARCYSISSSPSTDEHIKITVKRTVGGYGSNWLCDHIAAGDSLHMLAPSGTFVPDRLNGHLQLFAGGSGITPVMSIVKSVLATPTGTVALYYANRDRASVIFDAELAELVRRYPERFIVEHRLEDEHGLPTDESVAAFAADTAADGAFICGPAPFMALVKDTLVDASYDRHRIHLEEFRSLDGDPFAPLHELSAVDADTPSVEVTLDGDTHTLAWPTDATLIEVMVDAGIDAPYSCREGECGSCACTLVEGTVDPGNTEALDPDDVEEGYILGCQAKPTSRNLRIEF
ncbi:ferredoxin--NADP reductase [Rhodococcus pyridinivorans]|uniref:ferredoxin--NADP reductase n=1 Tax=Rhodococcus pyridinivorans TaxID=103816 RepID=UPI0022838B13|nr:ferredoxin--NADP reductase [Rhodococcus pyridinivorans]WAL49283.1 ferredoxin--NADP reductase [Rhodococcus pyridinivorans]